MLIQLLIIQAVTFVGLIFLLRVLFYRQLSSALTRLKRLHEENLARQEELKKELEKLQQEKEAELSKARGEVEQIVKEAREKAAKVSDDSQAFAKQEAQKLIEQGNDNLKKLEAELQGKYQERALDLSVQLLKFTFSQQGRQALQHELLVELIEEISRLPQDKFTVKAAEAKVTSAYLLNSAEKEKIAKILGEKMNYSVTLEEAVDAGLLAGLVIQVGALTIDGSLKNKLRKVVPLLKKSEND